MKKTECSRSSQNTPPQLTRRQVLAGLAATPVVLFSWNSESRYFAAASENKSAESFDAIVIGAGAIGCSTAWHLQQRGKRVAVLEAQPSAASQSTEGAGGFVASWSAIQIGAWGKTEWEMQRYGIDFYTKLAKRASSDIGFSPSGIAYIHVTRKGWKAVQPKIDKARELGTKLEILTPERAKELMPFLEFDQLSGIVFDPDAVKLRAGDGIRVLAKELSADGVKFEYNTLVTEFLVDGSRVVGVRAGDREFRTSKVIVTAGAWSRPLLAKLGADCPSKPFNETRYVTAPLPGLKPDMPLLIFSDHHGHYIREERGGLLIGGGDDHPLPPDREVDPNKPPWCNQLPADQAKRVRQYVKQVANVMPVLAQAEIVSTRSGMPTLTTSQKRFIAGPVPKVEGLFVMSGCQEAGVTHGPALGRILAEHAIDGKTHWDSSRFSLKKSFAATMPNAKIA